MIIRCSLAGDIERERITGAPILCCPCEDAGPLVVAPGVSETSCSGLRPFSGRSIIRLFSITVPMVAFSVSRTGAPPVTSMVSLTLPNCMVKSRRST